MNLKKALIIIRNQVFKIISFNNICALQVRLPLVKVCVKGIQRFFLTSFVFRIFGASLDNNLWL